MDLMGFDDDLMGVDGDFIGFHGDFMGFHCGFDGILFRWIHHETNWGSQGFFVEDLPAV